MTDPYAPPRAKPWPATDLSLDERLARLVAESGAAGLELATLPVRLGATRADVERLVAAHPALVLLGDRVFEHALVDSLVDSLVASVAALHEAAPLDPSQPLQLARARVAAAPPAVEEALRRAVRAGRLEIEGATVRTAGWRPRLDDALERRRDALAAALETAGREPPSAGELAAVHGASVEPLLRLLERAGRLVQVEPDRWYDAAALDRLVDVVRATMADGAPHTPAQLREALGFSRKFLIPFLEYCDRTGITARQGDARVWRGGGRAARAPTVPEPTRNG